MTKTVTHKDQTAYFGEEDHLKLAQGSKFSDLVFELLSDKKPTADQSKIFELILNLSIDHGPDTPSAVAVIKAAREGELIGKAIGEGVAEINDAHGGAIEPAMELMQRIRNHESSIKEEIEKILRGGKKIPGFGHRIYKEADPRAQLILEKLKESGMGEEFIEEIKQLGQELERQKGERLPLNIDGAIAVALCAFGWDPKLGKAVFIIARTPGLCAHYLKNSA